MNETPPPYTTGFVTSKDGTKIGYRQFGTGPALVLVHGAMMTAQNFTKLAICLSTNFTVYVPDRQGRGLSEPRKEFGLQKEMEDIQALVEQKDIQNIFGLSSGAIISLQTAISTPALKKVALYEPPIPANSTEHSDWFNEYERALAKGNFGKAFIRIIKSTGDPSFFTALPFFIISPLMNFAIKQQDKKMQKGEMSLKALIATFPYDYKVMRESEGIIDRSKDLNAQVLLLGGTKSQQYLKTALDSLMAALPRSNTKRVLFPGFGHIAADNSGKPEMVAKKLNDFFSEKNDRQHE